MGSSVMAWLAGAMVMLALTGSAGAQSTSPAWRAVMVQSPAPVVTSPSSPSSHGPSSSSVTGSPEPLVAPRATGASPKLISSGSGSSVMAWLAGSMVMLALTGSAGAQSTSPAWRAVMVQSPAPVVTSPSSPSSHGPSSSSVTGSPEPLVAPRATGASPKLISSGSGSSVMACWPRPMRTIVLTGSAGAQSTSPAWLAVMVQRPEPSTRSERPSTSTRPLHVEGHRQAGAARGAELDHAGIDRRRVQRRQLDGLPAAFHRDRGADRRGRRPIVVAGLRWP